MKKLLTILGAVGLTATAGAAVVACGNKNKEVKTDLTTPTSLEVGKDELTTTKAVELLKAANKDKNIADVNTTAPTKAEDVLYLVAKDGEAVKDKSQAFKVTKFLAEEVKATTKEGTPTYKWAEKGTDDVKFTLTVKAPSTTPNLDALKTKITEAKAIVIGDKTQAEFDKLQTAIGVAEAVTEEDKAADALTTLSAAIEAFNSSAAATPAGK